MHMSPPPPSDATPGSGPPVPLGALVPLTRPGWTEAGRHLLAALSWRWTR
ncbi:hypothetical protein ACFQVA_27695 [Actinomadura keratinilytica]